MNILIIGGAGFIGFNLYNKLRINSNLTILDFKKKIQKKNFSRKTKFIYGDISKKNCFKSLEKKKNKFDLIYHLAAETSTYLCEINPEKCFRTNILGSVNVFNYCLKFPPKKLIFTSSMAVYGKEAINVKENDNCKPISNYGFSKLFTEQLFKKLDVKKTNIKIFRIFNAYGPFQDFDNKFQGMLSIYLSQIFRNSQVEVTGSLERSRDFIFIDDIIRVITNKKILSANDDIIFNLASGKKLTVKDLLDKIFKLTNKKKKIFLKKPHKGDTFVSYANIKLLKKYGVKINFPITRGIKIMIKDIKRFDENSSNSHR